MNFLSHYFLDKEDERPHFVLGLVLPDLARNFSKHIRIREHHTHIKFENELLGQINEGVQRHLEVDHLFHNSDFFKNNAQYILNILKEQKFETITRHQYALAHIFLEMMLDRLLINAHENLCSDYYTMLSQAEEKNIEKYFRTLNFADSYWDSVLFFLYFRRYKHAKYLKEYSHNESFIFALNRVFSKINGQDFSYTDKKKLNHTIIETENYLSQNYVEIFNQINCQV